MAAAIRLCSSRMRHSQKAVFKTFSTNNSPEYASTTLRDLLCCLPKVDAPEGIGYQNVFRVLIMQFIDAYTFDVRSVKNLRAYWHPDGKRLNSV